MNEIKNCKKCRKDFPISYFHKHANRCKECRSIEERERYRRKRSEILQKVRIYREENKELIKLRAVQKYQSNSVYREFQKNYQRAYRLKNKRKVLDYAEKYRKENQDRINSKRRDYAKTPKGKQIETSKDYRRRAKLRNSNLKGKHTLEEWKKLLKRYNFKCADCQLKKELTRDHIMPISKGGSNDIDNIQPLCRSCNSRKRAEIRKFPEPNQVTLDD